MMMTTEPHNAPWYLPQVLDLLLGDFDGRLPADVIQEVTRGVVDGYSGARIEAYVPILARRQARELLRLRCQPGMSLLGPRA